MTAPPTQPLASLETPAPPSPPVTSELAIPRGAEPETAIYGPVNGRYDLSERIAKGGMGIVYRAHDRLLNRTVAVKVMRGRYLDRADLLRRFLAEARINGRLQHPGVVPVYEVGTISDGRPFIAMKLIEGRTLARLLRDRTTLDDDFPHLIKVFETLCQTMAYAHQQGVIHRDLKPDNIMVGEFGEVQVMDWGLAKFLDPAAAIAPTPDGFSACEQSARLSKDGLTPIPEHLTQPTAVVPVGPDDPALGYTIAGEIFGTLAYMPPEQARGEAARLDRRADVFALGAILCEILTGQPPYFGPTEQLRDMAREGRLLGAFVLLERSGADRDLIRLTKHCLRIDPDKRPADAAVLSVLVTDCLAGAQDRNRKIEVRRLTTEARIAEAEAREQLARRARRLSAMLAVAGVIVAGLFAAGLGWYANDRMARAAEETSRQSLVVQQIVAALDEAEAREAEVRRLADRPFARNIAAREARAACKRAEVLVQTVPSPPADLQQRIDAVRARVDATERGTRLAVALERWRADQFDGHGDFHPADAARACRDALHAQELDVMALTPRRAAQAIRDHSAATTLRDLLADWLAVTADPNERKHLAAILREAGEVPSDVWEPQMPVEAGVASIHRTVGRPRPGPVPSDALVKILDAEHPDELVRLADAIPTSDISSVGLAVVVRRLIEANQIAAAERLLVRGIRQYPHDYVLNVRLGMLLSAKPGSQAEAIRFLTVARAARPLDPVANARLGDILADAGRFPEAVDAYRRAIAASTADDAIRHEFARLVATYGDDQAVADLALTVEKSPDDGRLRAYLGEAQLRQGLFRKAIVTLRLAAEKLPSDSPDRDRALTAARTATRLAALEDLVPELLEGKYTPTSADGWAQMGDVCQRTKRYATAARFFARALELDKQYAIPAATCAALAGFGRGTDASMLSAEARAELRRSALETFRRTPSAATDPLIEVLDDPALMASISLEERTRWVALGAAARRNR